MLRYTNDHGQYYVVVGGLLSPVPSVGSWLNEVDIIRKTFNDVILIYGVKPVEELFRCYSDAGPVEVVRIGGSKPPTHPYNASLDLRKYGSPLTGIAAAARLLQGLPPGQFKPGREKQTYHVGRHGDIGPDPDATLWYSYNNANTKSVSCDFGGQQTLRAPDSSTYGGVKRLVAWNGLDGSLDFDLVAATSSVSPRLELEDLLFFWSQVFTSNPTKSYSKNMGGTWSHVRIDDYQYAYDQITNVGECWYQLYWAWGNSTRAAVESNPKFWWSFDIHLTFTSAYQPSDPLSHWLSGEIKDLGTCGSVGTTFYTLREELIASGGTAGYYPGAPMDGQYVVITTANTAHQYLMSHPARSDSSAEDPDFDALLHQPGFVNWAKAVEREFGHIRPSVFLSCSDALDDITGSLDNNLVEALSELGEVSALMPDLTSAFRSISALRQGRLVRSVKELTSFLTALRLQHKFGWDPSLDLLLETMPKMERVNRTLARLSAGRPLIGRGSFEFTFPVGEFGRQESTLMTRSRVVGSSSSQEALANLLGARARGLLPSPSANWDLIPFSFVVDWFVDIGARIRDLESATFLTLLGIEVITHTFLVESPWTNAELAVAGAQRSTLPGSYMPVFRVFAREVSQHVPSPRASKYDFRYPSRPPSWVTAGSLAFQLLKG